MRTHRSAIAILCLLAAASVSFAQSGQPAASRKYDEVTGYNCEDLMARLDNYAISLQQEPHSQAYIVSYGGSQGEREARMWAVAGKQYLTSNRGIAAKRIVTLYAGNRDLRTLELWLMVDSYRPSAAGNQTNQPRGVKFKKGRIRYRPCSTFFSH